MLKYLRTFSGCKVGEERLQLLNINDYLNKNLTVLVQSGYLQVIKDEKYRTFALTKKGKEEVIKRFESK